MKSVNSMKDLLGDTPYPPPKEAFDGVTYNPKRDYPRLKRQAKHGGLRVERRHRVGGIWEYRVVI